MHPVHSPKLAIAKKRAMWAKILSDFSQSELGPTAFCRKHDIRCDNFNYYRHQHTKKQVRKFIPVVASVQQVPTASQQIKIIVGKLSIHIPSNLSPEQISNIIKGVSAGC